MLSIFGSRCNKHNPLRRVSFYVNFVTNANLQKWFNWLSTTDKDKKMENTKAGFESRCVIVKENNGVTMTELERKFIIMARIVVALGRKGIFADIGNHEDGFAVLTVKLGSYKDEGFDIDSYYSSSMTEEELLDWWSAIEGDKCAA